MFQRTAIPSSSTWTAEDTGTVVLQNVGNYSPRNIGLHHRWTDSSEVNLSLRCTWLQECTHCLVFLNHKKKKSGKLMFPSPGKNASSSCIHSGLLEKSVLILWTNCVTRSLFSTAVELNSSVSLVFTRRNVVSNRRFGTIYRSHFQGSWSWTVWPLKMGPIGSPDILGSNNLMPRNNPEGERIWIKSVKLLLYIYAKNHILIMQAHFYDKNCPTGNGNLKPKQNSQSKLITSQEINTSTRKTLLPLWH
jgi:hypothetical protein